MSVRKSCSPEGLGRADYLTWKQAMEDQNNSPAPSTAPQGHMLLHVTVYPPVLEEWVTGHRIQSAGS